MTAALSHGVADIVRYLLIDNLSLGTLPSDAEDWPVYIAEEPDTPDSVITVYDTEGHKYGHHLVDGEIVEHPGVMIRVRAPNYNEGIAKARAIAVALDEDVELTTVTADDAEGTGSETYLVYAATLRSGPLSLGKEPKTQRNLFTVNATVALRQTS